MNEHTFSQKRHYDDAELQRDLAYLMIGEPFFAHILQGMGRQITKQVATAAVSWSGQMYLLLVNAGFFSTLSLAQRCAVLKHEVLHVVFRHITRCKIFNPYIFNVAADLVINQLCNDLPEGCLRIEDFNQHGYAFTPNGTTEEYYAILCSTQDSPQSCQLIWGQDSKSRGEHSVWVDKGDEAREEAGEACADWSAGALVLRAGELLRQKDMGAWGDLPAVIKSELRRMAEERIPRVHWKQALRTFVSASSRTRMGQTVSRPSKRFGTHPGSRIHRQRNLLVAIDTSGSTQEYLDVFYAELRHIRKSGTRIHVVECDCSVTASYPFSGRPPEVWHGGGGTAFDPVFDWMRSPAGKKAGPFDGCIYFTDGAAARPERPPLCRLLWVLPKQDGEGFSSQQELAAQWSALQPGRILQMNH
jgi:predicted metal-dependent peptidase